MSCEDCAGKQRLVPCEVHAKRAPICKDCCIQKHNGFQCDYFNVCW